jgi:hypothetical protein
MPLIIELRGLGVTSLGKIATVLNERNIPAPRGGAWHRETVSRLLAQLSGRHGPLPASVTAGYHRELVPLIERLVTEGVDSVPKLMVELNCRGRPRLNGTPWTTRALGEYLSCHCACLYDDIKSRGDRRRQVIAAAIDEIRAAGWLGYRAISEELKRRHVPTPGGRLDVEWTADLVERFQQRTGRSKPQGEHTIEIKRVLDGMRRRGVIGARALADGFMKEGVPTPSGSPVWKVWTVKQLCRRWGRDLHRPPMFWTPERIAEANALRARGKSVAEIAWELGQERRLTAKAVESALSRARRAARAGG